MELNGNAVKIGDSSRCCNPSGLLWAEKCTGTLCHWLNYREGAANRRRVRRPAVALNGIYAAVNGQGLRRFPLFFKIPGIIACVFKRSKIITKR